MSILDKMRVSTRPVNFRRAEDPYGVTLDVLARSEPVQPDNYNGYSFEQAYVTDVRLSTMWYANDAQLEGRKELAEKEILHFIYGPIIRRFNELRARSADRDWREVHRILDEIEKELME